EAVVENSSCIAGKEGRYMSVASGPVVPNSTITINRAAVSREAEGEDDISAILNVALVGDRGRGGRLRSARSGTHGVTGSRGIGGRGVGALQPGHARPGQRNQPDARQRHRRQG